MDPQVKHDDASVSASADFSEEGNGESTSSKNSDEKSSQHSEKKQSEIDGEQHTSVFRAKVIVYAVLIAACLATSYLIYMFTTEEEIEAFENDFRTIATQISLSVQLGISFNFRSIHAIGITMTSYESYSNESFPFVTLPNFEYRTESFRQMTGAKLAAYLPLIPKNQIAQWEAYSQDKSSWLLEGLEIQAMSHPDLVGIDPGPVTNIHDLVALVDNNNAFHKGPNDKQLYDSLKDTVVPLWQTGPAPLNASVINEDFLKDEKFLQVAAYAFTERKEIISKIVNLNLDKFFLSHAENKYDLLVLRKLEETSSEGDQNLGLDPHSYILDPVFEEQNNQGAVMGFFYFVIPWRPYFENILPDNDDNVDVVVSDNCGSEFTLNIHGSKARIVGEGDLHDRSYDYLMQRSHVVDEHRHCPYTLTTYPTDDMVQSYVSNEPIVFACVVAFIFIFTTLVFVVYDCAVQRRQWVVLRAAKRTQAVVTSLFPKSVHERILKDVEAEINRETKKPLMLRGNHTKDQLQKFLRGKDSDEVDLEQGGQRSKPIADLFPETTIMFADIVGFTAWSSTREPTQVFQLLEAVYYVFDEIAQRRRVFKVETIGDCYVAVAGLPQPRRDHALVMARFARDCLSQFNVTVKALVVELGPDTEDLCVRIGLHSGPVTAGVLRGERARFQLFGDTVNTTARIETTGQPNKIHCSQETADYLCAAGKARWLHVRREKVVAKGKGELQTFWLDASGTSSVQSGEIAESLDQSASNDNEGEGEQEIITRSVVASVGAVIPTANKYDRLVAWNIDILSKLLAQTITHRESQGVKPQSPSVIKKVESQFGANRFILEEVVEIIRLPKYEADSKTVDPWSVKLSDNCLNQLKDYVQTLAAMYPDNPFHNFEHASHVTMSVMKLLSRIVAPEFTSTAVTEETLHDHTFGITSDPMTQFAVALSALIHDVDHPGVPNAELVKEHTCLAEIYRNKSIAEQNSVALAWDLLMGEEYDELRHAIYTTASEFMRFRQLVVNIVLATDIMDKDLGALRRERWNNAFSGESSGDKDDDRNRKATIVMEHIIQASDVAHTMQHWQVYQKWNQRLFKETYKAWLRGRADKDPSKNWYTGQIGFFDFYIIPLAMKLKDCGVFGVSSNEYLQYAVQNRKQWHAEGQEVVAEMLEELRAEGAVAGELVVI